MQTTDRFARPSYEKVILAGILGFFFLVVGLVLDGLSFRSQCITLEEGIRAQRQQNMNSYSQMRSQIMEMSQVPDMYRDDLIRLYNEAMQGRYGAAGSQRVAQFVVEHNPSLEAGMYTRLQQAINSRRDSFSSEQQSLIDRGREYRTYLANSVVHVAWNDTFYHFPHIDLDRMTQIIVTNETRRTFETGRDEPIQLRR